MTSRSDHLTGSYVPASQSTFAPGSGVLLKSLFASYSASLRPGTRSRLGHAHRAPQRRERTVRLEAAAAEASRMIPPAIEKRANGLPDVKLFNSTAPRVGLAARGKALTGSIPAGKFAA